MTNEQSIRGKVARAYAKAVQDPQRCCCCGQPVQKGVAAKLAGYGAQDVASLPQEAVVNSFGSGNPHAFSEVGKGDVVLDLGSGAGIDVLIAAGKVERTGHVIGIDMTDEMIAACRKNIAASGLTNVEVRKGFIESLPVESSSVDWVISNCVINLSPDKPKVFSEIARVLKPGGRMIVSDIVIDHLPEWMRRSDALYATCVAGAISEKEYVNGLRSAGLEDIRVAQRLVYDASQIRALLDSEVDDFDVTVAKECGCVEGSTAASVVDSVTGKIWSARFHARRTHAVDGRRCESADALCGGS